MDIAMASPCANLFIAEICRRTCSTGQQQNRAYGGDTLMMSLQSGTMAKYTTDTSPTINQRVTPHHHVHSRMAHGPGDIPKNHCGDPIQNKCMPKRLLTHVNVTVQIVATHSPALLIHSIQRLSTWESDFKTRSEQLKIYLLACGSNKCTCTYCVLLLCLERKLSSPTHPNKPPITY